MYIHKLPNSPFLLPCFRSIVFFPLSPGPPMGSRHCLFSISGRGWWLDGLNQRRRSATFVLYLRTVLLQCKWPFIPLQPDPSC